MELEQKNKNDVANKKKKKIVVMWKIVGDPKTSVLYIYIDDWFYHHTSRLKRRAWVVYFSLSIYFYFYESDEILLKY